LGGGGGGGGAPPPPRPPPPPPPPRRWRAQPAAERGRHRQVAAAERRTKCALLGSHHTGEGAGSAAHRRVRGELQAGQHDERETVRPDRGLFQDPILLLAWRLVHPAEAHTGAAAGLPASRHGGRHALPACARSPRHATSHATRCCCRRRPRARTASVSRARCPLRAPGPAALPARFNLMCVLTGLSLRNFCRRRRNLWPRMRSRRGRSSSTSTICPTTRGGRLASASELCDVKT